jgi:hypothetical protein
LRRAIKTNVYLCGAHAHNTMSCILVTHNLGERHAAASTPAAYNESSLTLLGAEMSRAIRRN